MNLAEKKAGNKNNGRQIKVIKVNLNKNAALIYFNDSSGFPSDSRPATKCTKPAEMPISDSEIKIYIRLFAAENIPKSDTLSALAANNVKTKPVKADSKLPLKRI